MCVDIYFIIIKIQRNPERVPERFWLRIVNRLVPNVLFYPIFKQTNGNGLECFGFFFYSILLKNHLLEVKKKIQKRQCGYHTLNLNDPSLWQNNSWCSNLKITHFSIALRSIRKLVIRFSIGNFNTTLIQIKKKHLIYEKMLSIFIVYIYHWLFTLHTVWSMKCRPVSLGKFSILNITRG